LPPERIRGGTWGLVQTFPIKYKKASSRAGYVLFPSHAYKVNEGLQEESFNFGGYWQFLIYLWQLNNPIMK